MILKKSVLKVFEFIFIISIPLLFIAFVVYSMFNDELGISWIELVSMWLLSFAIITFSTYLHEFGHNLRLSTILRLVTLRLECGALKELRMMNTTKDLKILYQVNLKS